MNPYPDKIAWVSLLSLALLWGSSFLLMALSLQGFHWGFVVFARVSLAACVTTLLAIASREGLPKGREWLWCGAVGVLGLTLPFSLLLWALQTLSSGTGSIYLSAIPILVLLLASLFLGEKITRNKAIGFFLGTSGLLYLSHPTGAFSGTHSLLPHIACALAALCFATNGIVIKFMPPLKPMRATAGSQIMATIFALPLGVMTVPNAPPALTPLIALVLLGILHTGLAQALRYFTIKRAGPVFMSLVGYIIPVLAGLLGILILDEPLTARNALAYLLIISGVLISQKTTKTVMEAP